MTIERVAVTGGSGHIGSAIVADLSEQGYHAVNVDRERGDGTADEFRRADLLDAGEVYGALAICEADAVVHMGTINAPTDHPGHVTYESNVQSTYHVLEATQELGLESAVLASSINAMGSVYQDAPMEVDYLPVDEDHRLTPRDPYSVGKHAMEVTADGFGRLPDPPRTVSSLRFPWVAYEGELREAFAEADRTLSGLREAWHHTTRDALFSYLHVDDAASVARHALEADFEGHEAFWAVAGDTSAEVDSETLAAEYYPDAELRADLSGTEALISTAKARELLGWEAEHTWRDL